MRSARPGPEGPTGCWPATWPTRRRCAPWPPRSTTTPTSSKPWSTPAAALTPDRQETRAGHELTFATNLLGRFLLTDRLLPLPERGAPARVLVVTGPSPDRLDVDDLMARTDFKPFTQFRATNAANLLFAFELARRLQGTKVTANAYHPGALQLLGIA
jgi:NAD(P)-dependent dehydrogenase (short-subunit alcohol dehydrogenase family)